MLPITDAEIEIAEQCLLPVGKHFNQERTDFIKCLETCDLQAVPGSGKTTVLLAKILLIEKRLPLSDGSGILILSHTNAAVDEIKEKLKGHCSKIFSYPNFIGTIQSFVDEFLAIPFYLRTYGSKPVRIDNEIYDEKAVKFGLNYAASGWLRRQHDPLAIRKNLRFDLHDNLILKLNGNHRDFPVGNASATYGELLRMKKSLMERGYLHFDDAYYLAEKYLAKLPQIISLLRKRFKYVFVDEMQDMETHQYNLLEKLFFSQQGFPIFQRIGDRNQSIYSNDGEEETNWVPRERLLTLRGSHRLSQLNASVVRPFGLYTDTEILGTYESDLPPHLLIYQPENRRLVIQRFAELINGYKVDGRFPDTSKHPIKAIGWVGKPSEGNDHAFIADYFERFNRNNKPTKIDHTNLLGYLLFYDKKKTTFSGIRTSILNALVWVFREERILSGQRDFTKKVFLSSVKKVSPTLYDDFNLNLYKWCLDTLKGHHIEVQAQINAYLPDFLLRWKNHQVLTRNTIDFLTSINIDGANADVIDSNNIYIHEGINVEVATVHSVKGQTHSATLYMETYFHSYETEKCLDQMFGTSATTIQQVRKKAAAKILYVGLSRPTDLLCFAASSERVAAHRQTFVDNGWEIVEI